MTSSVTQGQRWCTNLPPVHLLHGTKDTCAPVENCTQFADALMEAGCAVSQDSCPVSAAHSKMLSTTLAWTQLAQLACTPALAYLALAGYL